MPHDEPLALYTLPDQPVLICHHCLDSYRATGSDVIELRAARDEQNWVNALLTDAARERELRMRQQRASPAKPTVPAASSDDIMNIGG